MRDAHYLRSQAELCLQMARQIHDAKLADKFRDAATQYHSRTVEAEPVRGDICANRFANWPDPVVAKD